MKFKKELIVQRELKSPVSEVFRTLRTNIQFMSTNKKLKTLNSDALNGKPVSEIAWDVWEDYNQDKYAWLKYKIESSK